jgi:hypothetical protein
MKEAIADAKAVRETALANAKIALEEAFTPRLQSMLSAKLSEDEEMGYEEEPVAEDEMPMDEPAPEEAPVEEPAVEEPVAEEDDAYSDEVTEDEEMMDEPTEEPVVAEDEEEDLELEAILRELEGEEEEVTEGEDEEEAVEEQSGSTGIGSGDNKMKASTSSDQDDPGKGKLSETEGEEEEVTEGEEEDVDLDEIINALREEEGDEEAVEENDTAGVDDGAAAELEEAYKVIRFMKSKLNEVNLLNAKLLFSNKLFRNHSLNEGQKMKVIENFDRAQTLREVKLVFATLTESFKIGGRRTKKTIKESYASRPSRSTKPSRKVLSEGSQVANRFKKLAGLI